MAYTVAQIRRKSGSGENDYMQTINVKETIVRTPDPFDPDNKDSFFEDLALVTEEGVYFQEGSTYYLRISVLKIPQGYYSKSQNSKDNSRWRDADSLKISLSLRKQDHYDYYYEGQEQIFLNQSFQVNPIPEGEENLLNTHFSFTTVFTPKKSCKMLVFRINRISYDKLIKPRNWLLHTYNFNEETGYTIKDPKSWEDPNEYDVYDGAHQQPQHKTIGTQDDRITWSGQGEGSGDLCILYNIISNDTPSLLKIGFQARPGTLIVVNKYPIRLGRSGIYEVNNGTKIHSVMITAPNGYKNSNIDAFLLDYAYQNRK